MLHFNILHIYYIYIKIGIMIKKSTGTLEYFKEQPHRGNLVITDMTMPMMTCELLANELMGAGSDIPVIFCTEFSENIDESKAQKIGASGYIEKLLDKRTFTFKVRRVLDKKR